MSLSFKLKDLEKLLTVLFLEIELFNSSINCGKNVKKFNNFLTKIIFVNKC